MRFQELVQHMTFKIGSVLKARHECQESVTLLVCERILVQAANPFSVGYLHFPAAFNNGLQFVEGPDGAPLLSILLHVGCVFIPSPIMPPP